MNVSILVAIITVAGTLLGTIVGAWIGGRYSLKAAKISFKKETMEKEIRKLANQVKSYWYLEKEYLSQIKALDPNKTPEDTIMKNTREAVEKKGYGYPKMTSKQADDILQKYE